MRAILTGMCDCGCVLSEAEAEAAWELGGLRRWEWSLSSGRRAMAQLVAAHPCGASEKKVERSLTPTRQSSRYVVAPGRGFGVCRYIVTDGGRELRRLYLRQAGNQARRSFRETPNPRPGANSWAPILAAPTPKSRIFELWVRWVFVKFANQRDYAAARH